MMGEFVAFPGSKPLFSNRSRSREALELLFVVARLVAGGGGDGAEDAKDEKVEWGNFPARNSSDSRP